MLDPIPGTNKFRGQLQRALLDTRALAPNDLGVLLRTQLERDKFLNRGCSFAERSFSRAEIEAGLKQLHASGSIFLDTKIAVALGWLHELQRLCGEVDRSRAQRAPGETGSRDEPVARCTLT